MLNDRKCLEIEIPNCTHLRYKETFESRHLQHTRTARHDDGKEWRFALAIFELKSLTEFIHLHID
jgi:hypothetical protein